MLTAGRARLTVVVFALVPSLLAAGTVATLTQFANGQTADAAQVNANFGAIKTAVDDNASRLVALEAAAVRTFSNTVTTGWPGGYTSAEQKWTRIGDLVVYSVRFVGANASGTARGGNLVATHAALGTPTWARPTTATVMSSPLGVNDNAPTADGAAGVADGPLARAMNVSVSSTQYAFAGFGSLGGQNWTVWAPSFTVAYHLMD